MKGVDRLLAPAPTSSKGILLIIVELRRLRTVSSRAAPTTNVAWHGEENVLPLIVTLECTC